MLKIWAAEVMIYGEDFTQWSETAQVETKIKIECDNLMEGKGLRKFVYMKEDVR